MAGAHSAPSSEGAAAGGTASPPALAAQTLPGVSLTFYKRELPCPPAIEFSSEHGKAIFAEALSSGTMNVFFKLVEQFRTQDEPAFCGLASLAMVLNALSIDPRRAWKGPWRWFHEEMLDCCLPLGVVRSAGVTLDQAACLARCNGAAVEVYPAPHVSLDSFRAMVRDSCASATEHLIVSYSRKAFGQTGDGHFSPVGGYSERHDLVLILDTARFKYPPHWVPLPALHAAMRAIDPTTGRPRGFMRLGSRPLLDSVLFTLDVRDPRATADVLRWLDDAKRAADGAPSQPPRDTYADSGPPPPPGALAAAPLESLRRFLATRADGSEHASSCVSVRHGGTAAEPASSCCSPRHGAAVEPRGCSHGGAVEVLLSELRGTEAFAAARAALTQASATARGASGAAEVPPAPSGGAPGDPSPPSSALDAERLAVLHLLSQAREFGTPGVPPAFNLGERRRVLGIELSFLSAQLKQLSTLGLGLDAGRGGRASHGAEASRGAAGPPVAASAGGEQLPGTRRTRPTAAHPVPAHAPTLPGTPATPPHVPGLAVLREPVGAARTLDEVVSAAHTTSLAIARGLEERRAADADAAGASKTVAGAPEAAALPESALVAAAAAAGAVAPGRLAAAAAPRGSRPSCEGKCPRSAPPGRACANGDCLREAHG